jgi:hypothetical protein
VTLAELKKKAEGAALKGADVAVVLNDTRVRVEPSGLSRRVRTRVYRVLTPKGAKELTVLRFDYDPNTGYVEIRDVAVHRKNGKRQKVDFKVKDLPQPARSIMWGARMKLVALPRLRAGEYLEVVEYRKGFRIAYLGKGKGGRASSRPRAEKGGAGQKGDERFVPPLRGHFDDVVLFGKSPYPTIYQRYTVRIPAKKTLQHGIYNGAVRSLVLNKGKHLVYSWWAEDLDAYKKKPMSPNPWDFLPKVVLSTVPSWKVKSRWFYEANEKQFEADAAIRKKVAELTRGLRSDREKIIALTRWVAANIRYRGMSMGREEGYTLHKGTQIFRERAGVCKDIAGMLITMLRAAGFTVYPAMTMAGARVERVPADQFNHCVVALERKDGSYWLLDPTWVPYNRELWSNAERGQHYLVGTPQGETLMRTPEQGPDANWLRIESKSSLKRNGALEAKVSLEGAGYPESRLRRLVVRGHSAVETRWVFERMARRVQPNARVKGYGFTDPDELNEPFGMRFTYQAEGYGRPGAGLLWLRIPMAAHLLRKTRAAGYLEAAQNKRRNQPVLLWLARKTTLREEMRLPKGYRLASPPVRVRVKSSAGSFEGAVRQQGRSLVMEAELVLSKRYYTARQYPKLRALVEAFDRFGKRRYLVAAPKSGERGSEEGKGRGR